MNNTNSELVKMMEGIVKQRDEIQDVINQEEDEKKAIDEQMRALKERLDDLNGSLSRKYTTRNDYQKTIDETQSAFNKILESS